MFKRIKKMKDGMFSHFTEKKEFWGRDCSILDEKTRTLPLVMRRAIACAYLLQHMPAQIREYELIVGLTNYGSVEFGRTFPKYALPEEKEEAAKWGFSELSTFGHHPGNYEKLLAIGLCGYRAQIQQHLFAELQKPHAEIDQEKIDNYRAMLICVDALRDFARRYADLSLALACKEKDPERKQELIEIARTLQVVPENPARTFQEALQSCWLVFSVLHSCLEYIPIGRADQFLYPYYKRDIEQGVLTREQAKVLLAAWLIKFSDRVILYNKDLKYMEYAQAPGNISLGVESLCDDGKPKIMLGLSTRDEKYVGASGNNVHQNMILSGQTPDGQDATNDLTYLMLETWSELELINPVMSVRFSPTAPQRLYDTCAAILRCGSGEPALYNDAPIVRGLADLGIPLEEARGYSNDGCWETLIPGKSDYSLVTVEVAQCLEYALFRGKSLLRGETEGIDVGDPCAFKTYEAFYEAYLRELYHIVDWIIDRRREIYGKVAMIAPNPMMSIFMEDCIARGKDVYCGGARYVFHALIAAGFSCCVDSLAAIKKMVYEDRLLSMPALLSALQTNFEGKEALRQQLLNWVPKFGNDDDYVDEIAVRLLGDYAAHVRKRNEEDMRIFFPVGVGTFERSADFGFVLGASADGRKASEPVGSNFSPVAGRDNCGPTAAIKSTVKRDLMPYFTGCPLDIQVNANEVRGQDGIQRLSALIRSFMDLGGIIFTITGVSEEMLKDAQIHPEKHTGLRVRLGGFSGYFVQLSPDYQQIVIERTKHGI